VLVDGAALTSAEPAAVDVELVITGLLDEHLARVRADHQAALRETADPDQAELLDITRAVVVRADRAVRDWRMRRSLRTDDARRVLVAVRCRDVDLRHQIEIGNYRAPFAPYEQAHAVSEAVQQWLTEHPTDPARPSSDLPIIRRRI
jgi:hypothetical protein